MVKPIIAAGLTLLTACAAHTYPEAPTVLRPYLAPVLLAETEGAAPETYGRSAAVCDIRETKTALGVRLEAIAQADKAVRGTYEFVVTAHSSGGSSDVTQGGPVDLAAEQSVTVGAAEISSRRYRSILKLWDADGALCGLERRS